MKYRLFASISILLISVSAHPADIARKIHTPTIGGDAFAELGVVVDTGKMPLIGFNGQNLENSADTISSLGISVMGRLEYNRFFVEFIENSFSNATLGAKAWQGNTAEVELIFSSLFGKLRRRNYSGLESINDRKADFNAGIRGSYYFGNNSIVQLDLVHDVINSHNGFTGSLQFGQQAQVRNWNMHALIGVRYLSKDVIDHLFGVSASEATTDFPEYRGEHGFMPTIQIGAALPLSEKWVFRALGEYSRLPDSVTDSPLTQGDEMYSLQGGIYYVFGGD